MAPYEALYGRPFQSPFFWMEVGERTTTASDFVKDALEKVELVWKHLLTA